MNTEGKLDRRDIERLARIEVQTMGVNEGIAEIRELLKTEYVTRKEFDPVKRLVYGAAGFVLLGFLGAALAMIWV